MIEDNSAELICSCGGTLSKSNNRELLVKLVEDMGNPRYSRRKRQIKKNHKKWVKSMKVQKCKRAMTLLLTNMAEQS